MTLAHVARPLVLAAAAVEAGCDVVVACDSRYAHFAQSGPWRWVPVDSIPAERFSAALARGSPVFDLETLRRYLRDDLRLIESSAPDLVVGDFRLSLSVSARLVGVPYAAISNAYWSPYAASRRLPLPVLPLSRALPLPLARPIFDRFAPAAMASHCRPLNELRIENGMLPLGGDLRTVYTDADHTLYADAPEMFPLVDAPLSHRHIGPILWSPPTGLPAWWDSLPAHRPIVYVTLGSSGRTSVLERVLGWLGNLQLTVIASTAGSTLQRGRPPAGNVWLSDYLPGSAAAARSRLVICNGGSPTSQQALAAGVPVLGIASNMDQFLNMEGIVRCGAGAMLRADRLRRSALVESVTDCIGSDELRAGAQRLAEAFERHPAQESFRRFLAQFADREARVE